VPAAWSILVDEEDRENEGDLVIAAEHCHAGSHQFHGEIRPRPDLPDVDRGALPPARTAADGARQPAQHGTAFTVSIEAAEGVTTGISAQDRSRTVQTAVAKHAKPTDIVQPGHIFPLMAQNGGVLVRAGHTEAGCDLCPTGRP
jgi:3,4-dihydroxy 2-butanone 4-phosphate synthase/GTP cyclohydrolase II